MIVEKETGIVTRGRRNHQFDLLRIVFATLVLLAHAPQLTDGNNSRELLMRWAPKGMSVSLGSLGVDGFFLLSGFLILQSWQSRPALAVFMRKRILRIVPGYMVAALLSTIVVGNLASSETHFFRHLGSEFAVSVLTLGSPVTPPVFPGGFYRLVNGSLWTIPYEFGCYLVVAALGCAGLLRGRIVWGALTTAILCMASVIALQMRLNWQHFWFLFAESDYTFRWARCFLLAAAFISSAARFLFGRRSRLRL